MIARRFTLGQLALVAWALEERARQHAEPDNAAESEVDLRQMTGAELSRHVARLGA